MNSFPKFRVSPAVKHMAIALSAGAGLPLLLINFDQSSCLWLATWCHVHVCTCMYMQLYASQSAAVMSKYVHTCNINSPGSFSSACSVTMTGKTGRKLWSLSSESHIQCKWKVLAWAIDVSLHNDQPKRAWIMHIYYCIFPPIKEAIVIFVQTLLFSITAKLGTPCLPKRMMKCTQKLMDYCQFPSPQ